MAINNKFERLIEFIINEDEAKAKALFHKIVIEKSRDIYESLVDDESPVQRGRGAESLSDEIEGHQDVIDGEEIGEGDEDLDDEIPVDDEFGDEDEIPGEDEVPGDDMGGEEGGSLEDRVMNLEDAIDELQAQFDAIESGEENEEDNFPGIHDDEEVADEFGGEEDVADADEGDPTAELDDEAEVEGSKFGEASIYGESRKSPADLMREYVEKVTAVKPTEGDAVGSGGKKSPINSKSPVINGKNDMGGTTKNIVQGGVASDINTNNGPKKPSNAYSKGEKKMGQDKYENSPGANTKGYKDKKTAKTKEGSDTNGSQSVSKTSLEPGGKPGFKG